MIAAAASPPPPPSIHHHHHHLPLSLSIPTSSSPAFPKSYLHPPTPPPSPLHRLRLLPIPLRFGSVRFLLPPRASVVTQDAQGRGAVIDPELRSVLELATNSELYELERILFGRSYFSPLIKSISGGAAFDHYMIEEDLEERENFIEALESRFLFLAADARSTLRGWRPSYRNVLLSVRKKLNVPCSSKLPTEDLEVEIFVHLVHEYSTQLKGDAAALRVGTEELQSMLMKGGQAFAFLKMSNSILKGFSRKVILDAAKSQIENGFIKKAGQLAISNLEREAGLLAARQGLARTASRFLGLRSLTSFLGPLLLGTLLADVVIVMLGTDYARVLQAIYVIAQIRVLHTYRQQLDESSV